MIRITALNEEVEDEESSGEGEGGVTREALEEIALQQYARCLELQRKGSLKDARQLLLDLLDTELLYAVQPPEEGEGRAPPLLSLKYLCYRNIASISTQLGDLEAAVDNYLEASTYDPSDITLWYRLGTTSLKLEKFDLALYAFQRGVSCNAKHWLCLDSLVTITLGLGEYNDCIFTIYNALELDPDYLRGRAYRKHIFTEFPYVKEFVTTLNSLYKWTPEMDEDIVGEECERLIAEAKSINEAYTKQVFENKVVERLPVLTLNKPIENWSWLSVGESLVDMHMHITENLLSHACVVEVSQPEIGLPKTSLLDEPMEVEMGDVKSNEIVQTVQLPENIVEKIQDEKLDKTTNDFDKMEVDQDTGQNNATKVNEVKEVKKGTTRRRASSISCLQQWEWCNKRRSSRKKANRQDQNETIYDTLKRLLPHHLVVDENRHERAKTKEFKGDESLDTMDLYKLFEEKEKETDVNVQEDENFNRDYFNSEKEQAEVQEFIQKYVESTCDIITMLDDFVETLSKMWEITWPDGLGDIYMEANWCARQHFEPPIGYDKTPEVLKTFININLIHLETGINKLLEEEEEKRGNVETELLDLLKFLCSRKESLGENSLYLTIRFLWVKCHSLLYKDQVEFALDCLYYILYELNCLDEEGDNYSLKVPNFTKWPTITKTNCVELIKALERNKKLSTVPNLYEYAKYEEALEILQDSFKHCQHQASKQEWGSMALDWAVQLVTLMECLWALDDTEQCFSWGAICLHESLKQYMLCEPGDDNYDKWSLTVVKALMCLEHILKKEGSEYLETLPEKSLIRLVQDIIQIIVHQLDDTNSNQDMPLNTMASWVLLHFIFQREEDCGRMKKNPADDSPDGDIPVSLQILFIAHENVGKRGWCATNNGELIHFTLKTVIPRFRSPALYAAVESVSQYLEQCVFCLFGHPTKKTKFRYLMEHNATPIKLDWEWAQQIFDLYRPEEMPEFNSYRVGSITAESEQLFQNMLSIAPSSLDPHPHWADVIAYIEGRKSKLPEVVIELPYKMRDIYYLLADFYFKNNETVKALKYYSYDIVIIKNRFDSWAGMALARSSLLEAKLNSCETFKTEREYLTKATAVEGCFKKALEMDCSHSMLWIEYGAFVYGVHSFCSRMLKQASESLSMESFEVLESRKEAMLDTAHRCFVNAHRQWMAECQAADKGQQDERWLHYYMLGKIAEKKNEAPEKYLEYYQKASKFLQENSATYPTRINYNNPQNLSVEALEIHYRIHASILKYIEQHENKVIYASAGKSFKEYLDKCAVGPFGNKKKNSKESTTEKENESSDIDKNNREANKGAVKRSNSNDGEESTSKKVRISEKDIATDGSSESSKKNETIVTTQNDNGVSNTEILDSKPENVESQVVQSQAIEPLSGLDTEKPAVERVSAEDVETVISAPMEVEGDVKISGTDQSLSKIEEKDEKSKENEVVDDKKSEESVKSTDTEVRRTSQEQESNASNTGTSKDNSSSESSSSSSSEDSSSDSSTSSSDSEKAPTEMTQDQIGEIISICLENLEDCVSRFPQHYKALYRLAHFHFYYKRDKNVSRCRDLMLENFIAKNGSKLQGLFCERKNSNFFNGIWRIPAGEVDRPGSFASHMSRCVLITMEVLKEIDDNKTLLDLSLQLQRTPDAEKKYLRDSERIELSQQALSLCIRSIKGQLGKFSKVTEISKNVLGKKELVNLMLEVYRSYQKVQKHVPIKSQIFSGLLIEAYKLYSGKAEADNLLDKSIRKCQSIIASTKQRAAQLASNSSTGSSVQAELAPPATVPPPPSVPVSFPPKKVKPYVPIIPATSFLPHVDPPSFASVQNSYLPYLPMVDNPLLSAFGKLDPATAAMYIRGFAGVPSSGYQADFFRQIMHTMDAAAYMQQSKPYNQPPVKPKPATAAKTNIPKTNVTLNKAPSTSTLKQQSSPSTHKSFASYTASQQQSSNKKVTPNPLKASVGTPAPSVTPPAPVQPSLYSPSQSRAQPAHTTCPSPVPASVASGTAQPAHQTSASTVNAAIHTKPPAPHQQVSPGKTLQEKLAERQKQNPSVPEAISRSASTAFSGKIPSSLTITKTGSSGKSGSSEEQKQHQDSVAKGNRDAKKSIQFGISKEKLAQPTKVLDASEVIVLDDD